MPRGRKLASLTLTDEQQDELEGIAHSATLPYALVQRARMTLASTEGLTNAAVAKRVGATPHTVGKWRRRFREAGIQGLHDELRPGRPRTYDDDRVASVISRALQQTPDSATHWSTRALGRAEGISKSTVQRWFGLFGVKPHLAQTFKLSTDPFFIEKVRDIVALYLNPPTTRWSCVWTRSRRFRRSIAPSRRCRWAWATSKATPTTTSATARPRCLRPWTSPPGG